MSVTVEITANDDGTYTVSSEAPDAEQGEQGAMGEGAPPAVSGAGMPASSGGLPASEPSEPAGRTVKTMKEALTLAMEALRNDGKMPDDGADEANFNAGYGAKGGMPGQPAGAM